MGTMIFQIDFNGSRPIYLQIADEVLRAVTLGSLKPDDPLPSVRQLATELRVNPNTVQQAYRELERDGVLYVRRGRGSFVAHPKEVDQHHQALVEELADRCLRDAYRLGLSNEAFLEALKQAMKRGES